MEKKTLHFYNSQRGPKAIMLHYIRLETLSEDKHSSLFGPIVSY